MLAIRRAALGAALFASLAACADAAPAPPAVAPPKPPAVAAIPADEPPLGLLPDDVRPTHYTVVLQIEPKESRFSGTVEIAVELAKPRSVIWMHADQITPKAASVRTTSGKVVKAMLEQVHPSGLARLMLAEPLGPGSAVIRVDYSAPFSEKPQGLYRVQQSGKRYAVTQLEAISARKVFPSFDQPSFKTPFDVTLFVAKGDRAIANTAMLEHVGSTAKLDRMTFATTKPLPTYLLAFMVGPLDVVDGSPIPPEADRKKPLPLRSVSADGRGKELAFTNAHTGEVVRACERYTGVGYPYDKLDILAVPEGLGAMENAGAITFRESLVLLDPKPGADALAGFYDVMAHELAHQWFGDLVTAKWWDDIWLNEAFATWMSYKIAGELRPDLAEDVEQVGDAHRVMGLDVLASARRIRQPIRDTNDVANAFDGITYVKGAAVLTMFERYLGKETFQKGIHRYLTEHAHGNATVDDLMSALSAAAGRDVGAPFRTFLEQPGFPLVRTKLVCGKGKAKLHLEQSRFLLPGSTADASPAWQVPVCAKFADKGGVKDACTLLAAREGDLDLGVTECPAWVSPNADGVGYYRFEQAPADAKALARAGLTKLGTRDRMAFSDSVTAAFSRGELPFGDALELLAPFASENDRHLALDPSKLVAEVAPWFWRDPALLANARAYVGALYAPAAKRLGWAPKAGVDESSAQKTLRQKVLTTMAELARDPAWRKEAAARGRAYVGYGGDGVMHADAVDADLAPLALAIAVEEGDAAFFDALVTRLERTEGESLRFSILRALGHARAPELVLRAQKLVLDPRLHANEWLLPLETQFEQPELADQAWAFLRENFDALIRRVARRSRQFSLGNVFCDNEHARELEERFAARAKEIDGAPRVLAGAVETVRLCAINRQKQEPTVRAFFAKRSRP
jgi:alanyl aminopeptidase